MRFVPRTARTLFALALAACSGTEPGTTPTTPTPPVVAGPDGKLDGAPTVPALTTIPDKHFTPRAQDYALGSPELPGMPMSINTVLVALKPAATVEQVNALLLRLQATIVGGLAAPAGSPAGLMALRLPTRTHAELRTALETLRAAPEILLANVDVAVGATRITRSGDSRALWEWTLTDLAGDPRLGTWGMAAIRMPQAWNLVARMRADGVAGVPTGILDESFDDRQEDLPLATLVGPTRIGSHGVSVASIIAGKFDDTVGVDGVNPFAKLVIARTPAGGVDSLQTTGSETWGLVEMLEQHPELKVVNVSLGYNWSRRNPRIDSDTSVRAKVTAAIDGQFLDLALKGLALKQALPVIVAAAGNDQADSAVYSSMFANAALRQGNAAIIVVEADTAVTAGGVVDYPRASFTNVGGHLSAPGASVAVAAEGKSEYGLGNGTSFAAPYVTGVIGFLHALEPALPAPTPTTNPIRDLLIRTAQRRLVPEAGPPRLDAFAAALELDAVTNSSRVLRRLLDIDDGTIDGNTRIDAFSKAVVVLDSVKADTTINMADFRRWRDLMVASNFPGLTALDGAADHPKKDRNGDRRVGTATEEDIFPIADFNGDGKLSVSARALMAGPLAARGPMTDLEVLQSQFQDPDYTPAELDSLTTSGEIHFRVSPCGLTGTDVIRARIIRSGAVVKEHFFGAGDSRYTFTVRAGGNTPAYQVQLARLNASSVITGLRDTTVTVAIGGDVAIVGCPTAILAASVTLNTTVATISLGTPLSLTATIRDATGALLPGRVATWSSSATGIAVVTNGGERNGVSSATVTPVAVGTTTIRVVVDGVAATATITVIAAPPLIITTSLNARVVDGAFTILSLNVSTDPRRGTQPFTFSLVPPSRFVNGLTLSANGVISGRCDVQCAADPLFFTSVPGQNRPYFEEITVRVTDAAGLEHTAFITINFSRF